MVVRVWMKLQDELVDGQVDGHGIIETNLHAPVLHGDMDGVLIRRDT
jgi:hypothetical protein